MAKQAVATAQAANLPEQSGAQASQVPAFLREREMQGQGVSTKKEDILIPMARVLQPLSPEVLAGTQKVKGAESGDIWIKNAPRPLIKGNVGFIFQPCHFSTAIVEWKPRSQGGGGGDGLVNKHAYMPDDAYETTDPQNPERKITMGRNSGNVYVDTRYHAGFIIDLEGGAPPMPCYIPLSSSGHSVSKAWMLLMSLKRMNGKPVDSWAIYYQFKTGMKTKNGKSWFLFNVTDAGPVVNGARTELWVPTVEDFERGQSLYQALEAGEMALEEGDAPVDETAAGAAHDNNGAM